MELAWGRRFAGRQEQTERAPPEPLSVRSLTIAASVFIVILVVAAVASLVWSGLDTRRATDEWLRATQGQALVDAALVDLLTFRRLSDLWVVTGDPRVEGERRRAATELATDLAGARTLAVDPRERALLDLASQGVADYLAHLRAVEASTHDLQVIVTRTSPYVDRVARTLEAIRALHRDDIRAAYSEIRGTIVRTDVIGAGLALLLLGAMVALLAGAGRWIVAPVLSLHRALEAFRGGELGARAPERGAREVRDLAHAYNAMADTLAAQREGQLTYLAGVAHDLRNPLGAMKMGLSLIQCHEADASGRRALQLLDRQVDRMSRMVGDLLDATRIEAGRLSLREEVLDLRERAREAIELHAPSFPHHRIVLDEPESPVVVCGDPGRIDQVLNNLLTNALKYSREGSRVDVRIRVRAPAAVLEVEDRGIGMSPEQLRDLFAPFRRHAPAVAPGAGLGLSITRRIVEGHGGRIEVRSQVGVGSTFRVTLPLAEHVEDECGGRPDRG